MRGVLITRMPRTGLRHGINFGVICPHCGSNEYYYDYELGLLRCFNCNYIANDNDMIYFGRDLPEIVILGKRGGGGGGGSLSGSGDGYGGDLSGFGNGSNNGNNGNGWPPDTNFPDPDGGERIESGGGGGVGVQFIVIKKIPFTAAQYKNTGGYGGNCNCMCVAQKIMRQILGNGAEIGSSKKVIQLYLENDNGVLYRVGDAYNVFNILNAHLDANRPIITGVNHHPNYGINEGATDHWIVITGRGRDASNGQDYYTYIKTARSAGNGAGATSDNNSLYYNVSTSTFKTCDKGAYGDKTYTLTQIRPNR